MQIEEFWSLVEKGKDSAEPEVVVQSELIGINRMNDTKQNEYDLIIECMLFV